MKRISELLESTAEHLQALNHPRVSIAWEDLDLVFRRVFNPNPDLGGDIVGKKLVDILDNPKEARRLTKIKQKVLDTRKEHHEHVVVEFGGSAHTYDMTLQPTFDADGQLDGLMSVNIDLTDLIEAQERLKAANERLLGYLSQTLETTQQERRPGFPKAPLNP